MNRHILVTCAPKYGATKEISEKIGQGRRHLERSMLTNEKV